MNANLDRCFKFFLSQMHSNHQSLFPIALLGSLLPNAVDEDAALTFGQEIEKYIFDLVSNLKSYRSHNSVIRNAIVAIAPGTNTSSVVTTRDACKTLKNFAGVSIPDVTSIIQVATTGPGSRQSPNVPSSGVAAAVSTLAMPATPSAASAGGLPDLSIEEAGTAGAAGGIGIGAIIREKKSTAPVISLPPKAPKKRGRPSNKDRGLPPLPKRTQQ